jgi:hypothetical protein
VFVICGDFDHEAEVGLDHEFVRTTFPLADTAGDGEFLCAVEEGSFADASEIGVQGCGEFDVGGRDFHTVVANSFCTHIRLDWWKVGTFGFISRIFIH